MKAFRKIYGLIVCLLTMAASAQPGEIPGDMGGGQWTIVQTFTVPGKASGLAWDGQFVYFGQFGVNGSQIQRLDPLSGAIEFVCNGPMEDAYGLTWDGQYLWTTDHPGAYDPGIAYQFDLTGAVNYQFELPATYMGGIEYDNGLFWTAAYYDPDGMIYKVDNQGNVLKQFPTPGAQPWDICLQDEFLWIADYNDNMLYKVDTISGQLIESHAADNMKPAGVVFDGQYLWYVDGQLSSPSTLYKVDLGGTGTPVIQVPVTSWNYGNVAVNDSAVWDMVIANVGTYDLSIDNVLIMNAVPIFTWEVYPQIIAPGYSTEITLIFRPTEPGTLNTVVTIQSSDPVTPEVEVTLTGEAVISGPSIHLLATEHDYGNVRVNAYTRWYLGIENIGNEVLAIENFSFTDTAFFMDQGVNLPLEIAPLEIKEIGIWFNPKEAISYNSVLTLQTNDPAHPSVAVNLYGTGLDFPYPIGNLFWQYVIDVSWDNSPKAIGAIPDITGDGVDDVIIGSEDDFVRCFNGNASGTGDVIWEYEIYAGSTYQQNCLSFLDDVDLDGYTDVVFGTSGGDRSVTALSGKTGSFLWKFDTDLWGDGGWVYHVDVSYDCNGDGIKDALACAGDDANDTGPKRAFCLDGTNGSLIWDTPTGGPAFTVIGIADVTGDGMTDVFVGASNQSETQGIVHCLDGADGGIIWSYPVASTSVWAVAQLDDINNDGIPDVAAGDFGGHLYGFDGVDGGVLWSTSMGGSPLVLKFERLDDVDGDGLADILIGSSSSNGLVISGATGNNIWLKPLADKAWNVDRISDISGDAINDVLIGTLYSNNYVYFIDGINGDILKSINYDEAVDAIAAIPDINGDGSMELVAGGRDGKVTCYSGGLDSWTMIPGHNAAPAALDVICNPNPFIMETTIVVTSSQPGQSRISIMSAGGSMVNEFGDKMLSSGINSFQWDGRDANGNVLPRGIYFIIIETGQHFHYSKLIKY